MPLATFNAERDRWAFLSDSYWGGESYRNPSSLKIGTARVIVPANAINTAGQPVTQTNERIYHSYLVPHERESEADFLKRASLASYVPFVSAIVKAYAEAVTREAQRTGTEPLALVLADVTGRGHSWETFADECARWLALYGLGFAVVDAPSQDQAPVSRADELSRSAWPYAMFVHPSAVALYECDRWGKCTRFVYTDEPYVPRDSRGANYDVTLREWSLTAYNGAPGWCVRQGAISGSTDIGLQADALAIVDAGPLPAVLNGELPVVEGYYEQDASSITPRGISVVDDAADVARRIYNLLSWIEEIHRKAAFPFLAVPLARTGGQMDAATEARVGPGQGLGYDSATGAPQWIQPSSDSVKDMREHVSFLFALALRSAGLEVAADSSAQVQSGEALRVRSRDFDSRCSRFAGQMAQFERRVLRLIAKLSGANPDAIDVEYAKRFTLPDASEDLARAVTLLGLRSTTDLGDEATVEAVRQALIAALPTLSPERLDEIMVDVRSRYATQTEYQSRAMAREEAMSAAQLAAMGAQSAPEAAPTDALPPTG